jgi:rhodanese-related sulfurtransferase
MQQLQVSELVAFVAAAPDTLLLDVREPWEVQLAQLQLPGVRALNVPMQQVPQRLHDIAGAQPVVCICHHGARSAQVVAFLQGQGLGAVYNLAGGIDAWSVQIDPSVPRY